MLIWYRNIQTNPVRLLAKQLMTQDLNEMFSKLCLDVKQLVVNFWRQSNSRGLMTNQP